jgi:hypothetical protein
MACLHKRSLANRPRTAYCLPVRISERFPKGEYVASFFVHKPQMMLTVSSYAIHPVQMQGSSQFVLVIFEHTSFMLKVVTLHVLHAIFYREQT